MAVSKASLRGLRMSERMEKIREGNKGLLKTVKVTPKNDTLRKLLRHPRAGAFPKDGPAEWPDDRFTKRRLADGDISVEPQSNQHKPEQQKPPPHGTHRSTKHDDQSAA
jgi:hypothetical protein